MKNKLILVFFVVIFFSGITTFAAESSDKKSGEQKSTINNLIARTNALEDQIYSLKNRIDLMQKARNKIGGANIATLVELYAHGPAVVSSPAFGLRGPESNELLVDLTGINKDLYLLRLRRKMDSYAGEHGILVPHGPIIALSGGVEGQVIYKGNENYSKNSQTDINLSRAELFVVGEAGLWATGGIIINYDDRDSSSSGGNVSKSNNSRIQLDRGWLTVGQLAKCPAYFSIGQLYAPFGRYSSYMITSPQTKLLGRVKGRMVVLGYDQYGFQAQIYGLSGETDMVSGESTGSKIVRHSGFNLSYEYEHNNFKMRIGGGVLGNLAESQKMQDIFGFNQNPDAEKIKSRVLGYNGHVKFEIYDFGLMAEYISASKAFDKDDFMFNDIGAKPWALDIEGAYSFRIKEKPNTVFAGYSQSRQALALGLPKQSYFAGYSVVFIRNTLASIEYRHDVNYDFGNIAGSPGRGITNIDVTGRHKNTVTVQLGVYF